MIPLWPFLLIQKILLTTYNKKTMIHSFLKVKLFLILINLEEVPYLPREQWAGEALASRIEGDLPSPKRLRAGRLKSPPTCLSEGGYEKLQIFIDIINVLYYIVCHFIKERASLTQKKIARTIYIKDEQMEALKRLSEKTKVPQSVYVREALDMLLEKYSEQLRFEFKGYFKE
jgi:hypothetical protein